MRRVDEEVGCKASPDGESGSTFSFLKKVSELRMDSRVDDAATGSPVNEIAYRSGTRRGSCGDA